MTCLLASLLHRQRSLDSGRGNGDPRAMWTGQGQGPLHTAQGSSYKCSSITKFMPPGLLQDRSLQGPYFHDNHCPSVPSGPSGCPQQPDTQQVKTGCGGMAFLDSCSESRGMGMWASVRAQGVLESS